MYVGYFIILQGFKIQYYSQEINIITTHYNNITVDCILILYITSLLSFDLDICQVPIIFFLT